MGHLHLDLAAKFWKKKTNVKPSNCSIIADKEVKESSHDKSITSLAFEFDRNFRKAVLCGTLKLQPNLLCKPLVDLKLTLTTLATTVRSKMLALFMVLASPGVQESWFGGFQLAHCLQPQATSQNWKRGPLLLCLAAHSWKKKKSVKPSKGSISDRAVKESSEDIESITSLAIDFDRKAVLGRTLKLQSGSSYLPHPNKAATGGEDAHFICVDEQVIGLADGVGGWANIGVDAGLYSRALMSNSVKAIQVEPKDSIDPARVLKKAHLATKHQGSSTACIIALKEEGLHAINVGDSGFVVIRDGCSVFRSPVQQHGFNYPFQLANGNTADRPSNGQVFKIPVAVGDVIVAGTDGLFDNLYPKEITELVVQGVRSRVSPEDMAKSIAWLARMRALDRTRKSPFSTAAQTAGYINQIGGKLDDTTVLVSFVTSSTGE